MSTKSRKDRLRTGKNVFGILSALCTLGPIIGFGLYALINDSVVVNKVSLCFTMLIVLVLSLIAAINKFAFKSKIWIIMIGLYLSLDFMLTPIIVVGVCQIADELIFTPLYKYFKRYYEIRKEIGHE